MAHVQTLRVATPEEAAGAPEPTTLPAELAPVAGAGRTINHALLLAEPLAVPVAAASDLLAEAARVAELAGRPAERTLLPEDAAELRDAFAAVRDALDAALDAEGRPSGPAGAALAEFPLTELDDHGRVVVRSHHVLAADLADDLARLVTFLDRAAAGRLWLTLA